jgi:hypothetical protein
MRYFEIFINIPNREGISFLVEQLFIPHLKYTGSTRALNRIGAFRNKGYFCSVFKNERRIPIDICLAGGIFGRIINSKRDDLKLCMSRFQNNKNV